MPTIHLANDEANRALAGVPAKSVHLVITSPRYLDVIDYGAMATGNTLQRTGFYSRRREPLSDYVREHLETCGWLAEVCADDAVVAIEIDDYRDTDGRCLIPLPDLWRDMLTAHGFRYAEHIRLFRPIALGRRSGHFVKTGGRPGTFYPDNVCSTLIVAIKGDPQRRLRRLATDGERIDLAWARRSQTTAWRIKPPGRRTLPGNHPVPFDPDLVRALITLYSRVGDRVLDPFAGSGTVGREASALGRDALLIEREAAFAEYICATLRIAPWRSIPRRVCLPSAQLALPLGHTAVAALRDAYERKAMGEVTDRFRRIAALASSEAGVDIPPELAAVLMRAERAYWYARRAA